MNLCTASSAAYIRRRSSPPPGTAMHLLRSAALLVAASLSAATGPRPSPSASTGGSKYLFVWTGDGDRKASDFLVVIDADPASKSYGHVVTSLPVGATATMPHHTEYEFPRDAMLFANGWAASRTFVLDLRQPTAPRVARSFTTVGGYSFPHSFVRLPNGHLLGTFQGKGSAYAPPGGLVELDEHGRVVRAASAAGLGLADTLAWPYSLAIDAKHDRVVVTNTTMGIPAWLHAPAGSWGKARVDSVMTSQIEIWSLSRLQLLHVLSLPKPPSATVSATGYSANDFAAEPRLLPDGSMYVNTFACGLFRIVGIDGGAPRAEPVHVFPSSKGTLCAVPAIVGHYFIQTVAAIPGLVALDIRDPAHPVEVSRLTMPKGFAMPHWLAADPSANRIVVTGDDMGYVLVVNVDPRTGKLAVDDRFRDERTGAVGVSLDGRTWPHGAVRHAFVHGTLFGPRTAGPGGQ